MSADINFQGKLTFASVKDAKAALAEAHELLDGEDEEFTVTLKKAWKGIFRLEGTTLTVNIALGGPAEWWFAVESLVETVCEAAESGFVEGAQDGAEDKERYEAGGGAVEEEDDG